MTAEMSANKMTTAASPTSTSGEHRLSGNMGTAGVAFTVLAFNAPLAATVGFVPVIVGVGNQLGAPVTYLAAGALVMLFAVGFTTMSRHLPNPGAFYAYITAGLGREAGLGASFLALFLYIFMVVGGYIFGGIALNSLVHHSFHGPDIPWWAWVLVLQAVVGLLGYFKVDISAKVLSLIMCGEVVIVAIWNAVVLFDGGPEGLTATSFSSSSIFSGSVGLALLFGITCFTGFEATAIFRDEVRDPEKTIPRATYIAVATMASMYALAAYVLITGYGPSSVVDATAADPAGSVLASYQTYLGSVAVHVVSILLCTSIFASILTMHNVTARYVHSLSVDQVLPSSLGHVHPRHGSPYRASLLTSAVAVVFLATLGLAQVSMTSLYATLIGIGGYALIVLLLLTSIAIPGYFMRRRPEGVRLHAWKMIVSPLLAAAGFAFALYLATDNIVLLTGQSQTVSNLVLALAYGTFVLGFVVALVLRRRRPATYARIGRQDP
ncbi:Amino acid permease-associated region (plasmid) [Rhodococcus opacus]|uniref:Amino acid permease-associated region n=1 Tax=Rhodococcus opacus TaxID=37919 RepID=A0A1B1KGW9_RHOOP|nr:APC family permease [Rhodococcus opacus]ANS31873.1 Amino acid permease-associated region [Rhodococcus opacus]